MKKISSLLISFSFIVLTMNVLSATETAAVTPGKVAELGCHRLERLVTLGKINETFLTKLQSLQIIKLEPAKPTDPSFKVVASQYAGLDGTANSVEMMMDANGKAIAQTLKAGADAQNSPVWSDKDAATLVENSLHYIAEANNPEAVPFFTGLTSLKLKQVKNAQGEKIARVEMLSKDSAKTFEINLKEDGTVESANTIIP